MEIYEIAYVLQRILCDYEVESEEYTALEEALEILKGMEKVEEAFQEMLKDA